MSNKLTFTIITASFNNKDTIEKTILSIKDQTFDSIEHIIIDGGSTDGTLEIIKKYQGQYNLQWISEPDRGIADALNKGIQRAKGEYIIVIHADDYLINEHILADIYQELKNEQCDMYCFPIIQEHGSAQRLQLNPTKNKWRYHFKTPFLHQGTFIHREVFQKNGIYNVDLKIAMDYDFFYRILQLNIKIKINFQSPVVVMRAGGIGSDRNFVIRRIQEEFLVQQLNEKNQLWRLIQNIYRALYFPYKMIMNKMK